jgi:hypothetical protein
MDERLLADFDARTRAASTVDAVRALISEITHAMMQARGCNDEAGNKALSGHRMAARRHGGMLLFGGGIDAATLSFKEANHWRRLARLSPSDFQMALKRGSMPMSETSQHARMVLTAWTRDERGNMSRKLYAIDGDAS